jgi:hypothetical protein
MCNNQRISYLRAAGGRPAALSRLRTVSAGTVENFSVKWEPDNIHGQKSEGLRKRNLGAVVQLRVGRGLATSRLRVAALVTSVAALVIGRELLSILEEIHLQDVTRSSDPHSHFRITQSHV